MTGGISDNSSVSWSSDTLNELNNIAAGIAQDRIISRLVLMVVIPSHQLLVGMDVMNVANSLLSGEDPDIKKALSLYFAWTSSNLKLYKEKRVR